MANIELRRNTESSLAPRASVSSVVPSAWGRLDPVRFMNDFFRWDPFLEMAPLGVTTGLAFSPDFEIQDTPDRYLFQGDLPGVADSDVEISVTGNRLTISGKRDAEQTAANATCYCSERSYGSFSRSFTLPAGADPDRVKADLKNGVLTVEVSKTAESQPRRIALGAGQAEGSKQARA